MKNNRIIAAVAAVLALVSCETQLETVRIAAPEEFVAPVMDPHPAVLADADNIKTEEITFTWKAASFGANVQIQYSVYAKYGEKTALLGQSSQTFFSISKTDFMGVLCNDLKCPKNADAGAVETYVTATIYGSAIDPIQSNIISYNVTTYVPTIRSIYLPGKYNGWTKFGGEFFETDGGTNIYKTLVDVSNADETPYYFKLVLSDGSWTGFDKIATDGWSVADDANGDKNYSVPETDSKLWLSVNLTSNKISKESVSHVELRGDFDGWGDGAAFEYDPTENVWKVDVTFATDGSCLLLLNRQWAGYKFGNGTKASEDVEGGFLLDQDNDAANISVAAGEYTMILHANRTPFVLVPQKK